MAKRKRKTKSVGGELGETLSAVGKRYGEKTIRTGSQVVQPGRISTGSFILDFALLGGIPENRISMVVGERSAGKSTIANKIIANAQQQYPDEVAVYVDVEGTYDATWGGMLGIDNEQLQLAECETGEMAVDIADAVTRSRESSLVVIDSIAALTPMKEIEDSAEDAHVALQARLVGNMIRRVNSALIAERKRNHWVTVLFVNQFRNRIGGMSRDNRTMPGGKALEFCTSLQWIMKNHEIKGKSADDIDNISHNDHSFTITKNKINTGPRVGEFKLCRQPDEDFGLHTGDIDDAKTMLAYSKKFGIYSGGGQKWTLELDGFDIPNFRNAFEAQQWLYEDPVHYWGLRCELLRRQAASLGMPSEFIETIS